jgi:hypothetical protein
VDTSEKLQRNNLF